jgi:hypothetical protein
MMATADTLRRAANLIETGSAGTAASGIYLALTLDDQGDYQAGQPFDTGLYEQAQTALAAHLGYATDRDPTRDLRRWSQLRTPHEMAVQMRAAADAAERGAL